MSGVTTTVPGSTGLTGRDRAVLRAVADEQPARTGSAAARARELVSVRRVSDVERIMRQFYRRQALPK